MRRRAGIVLVLAVLGFAGHGVAQETAPASPSVPPVASSAIEAQLKNLQVIIQQQQVQITELLKRTADIGDQQSTDTLAAAFDQAMVTAEARRCAAARLPYRITYSPQAGLAIVCDRLVRPSGRAWWRLWLW